MRRIRITPCRSCHGLGDAPSTRGASHTHTHMRHVYVTSVVVWLHGLGDTPSTRGAPPPRRTRARHMHATHASPGDAALRVESTSAPRLTRRLTRGARARARARQVGASRSNAVVPRRLALFYDDTTSPSPRQQDPSLFVDESAATRRCDLIRFYVCGAIGVWYGVATSTTRMRMRLGGTGAEVGHGRAVRSYNGHT